MKEERIIFENTKLEIENFNSLFNDILLSEIIPYNHDQIIYLGEIKGITFFGKTVPIEKYYELSRELEKYKLKLLISHNTLTKRWRDFVFPNFPDKDLLLDIEKQCYSIISETNTKELIKYIYSYNEDRELLNKTFENWINKYNLDILWNDYFDIVLLFQNAENKKEEISKDIDNLLYYKNSNELTLEQKIEERFQSFPIVSLYLK